MPIFEYRCNECSAKFEALVLNDEDTIACISCNSQDVEKMFSAFGIHSNNESTSTVASESGCGCSPVGCGCTVSN